MTGWVRMSDTVTDDPDKNTFVESPVPYHDAGDVARITELTASLIQLIARIRRIGGHSTPEEQDQLWAAERLVRS